MSGTGKNDGSGGSADRPGRDDHRTRDNQLDSEDFSGQENHFDEDEISDQAVPLCLGCMQPVDPYTYYCPNCGEAVNGLTQYIPFVNIRWQVGLYGKLARQLWSKDVSLAGKVFRVFIIIVCMPLLLLLLLPFMWSKIKENKARKEADDVDVD